MPPTTPPTIGPTAGPPDPPPVSLVVELLDGAGVEPVAEEAGVVVMSMLCDPIAFASVRLKPPPVHVDGSFAAYSGMVVAGGTANC